MVSISAAPRAVGRASTSTEPLCIPAGPETLKPTGPRGLGWAHAIPRRRSPPDLFLQPAHLELRSLQRRRARADRQTERAQRVADPILRAYASRIDHRAA